MSHFIFVEKTNEKTNILDFRNFKNCKNIVFFMFFAKNENFDESASWWSEKKIFRDGPDDPKNEFKTLLSNAAIKKYGRLMKFSHFWWFDFFHFLEAQKIAKITFSKNANFAIFSIKFHQIRSFFVIFDVFCLQNPFLLSKF